MTEARKEVTFRCAVCRAQWRAAPDRVEDDPEAEHHPWRYFAARCTECDNVDIEQAAWERNLMKAHASATGPKTPEGKAASARNLVGHPTPEEAKRTRFNAMKHGLFSKVATYFPAKPGQYPHCTGCQWLRNGCGEWDHGACLTRTELFMKHRIAFETRDPGLLVELRADLQANVTALLDDMVLAIVRSGVELRSPEWYTDKEGVLHVAHFFDPDGRMRTIEKIEAHPLLDMLFKALSRNALTLTDMGMTPKVQEDHDMVRGHIEAQGDDRETLLGYQRQQTEQLARLSEMIERSRHQAARDPVLLEHQQAEGEDDALR